MAVGLELCSLQFLVWVPAARLVLLGSSVAVPLGQSLDWLSALPRRKLLLDFLDFLFFCSYSLLWMGEEACFSASSSSSVFLRFCYLGLSSLQALIFLFCDFWIWMVMNVKGYSDGGLVFFELTLFFAYFSFSLIWIYQSSSHLRRLIPLHFLLHWVWLGHEKARFLFLCLGQQVLEEAQEAVELEHPKGQLKTGHSAEAEELGQQPQLRLALSVSSPPSADH